MRVGDYVRTKDGKIGKIIQEEYITPCNDKHEYIYLTDADNEMWYDEETIIKSSPNIIDLIEVGDYVNGRIVDDYIYLDKLGLIGLTELEKEDEKFIKSIVTKERFESVEYKVGE